MVKSAVVIFFDPTQRQFLVGKESSWVTNIKTLSKADRDLIDTMFQRKIANRLAYNDPGEISYYKEKLIEFKRSPVMDRIKPLSESHPPRITFGDIKYKEKDGVWYSYTIPQYLTAGSKPNFPAGGRKHGINSSIKETAAREFYEESGIDLSKEPFDLSKLIDLGLQESGYRIYSYIPTEEEFKEAQSNIHAKNLNGFAEVHALEFVSTKTKIATHARRQFGKFTKKTKGTKQRWRRTVRTLQKY
jgi:hypothetical protein